MRLVQPVGAGWIAAGDAALAFDPLSSQGILTALYTGMRAAEAVVATHHGDRVALAHYAARIDAIAATYHQQLRQYYAIEQRWHDAPFWRKRQIANTISYGLLKADGQ
jgi:flavin-dependent dehydrogenase